MLEFHKPCRSNPSGGHSCAVRFRTALALLETFKPASHVARRTGSIQDQLAYPLRGQGHDLLDNHAAHGVAKQIECPGALFRQIVENKPGIVLDTVRCVKLVAFAEARLT